MSARDDNDSSAVRATACAPPDVALKRYEEPVSEDTIDDILSGVEAYKNGDRFYTGKEVLKMQDSDDDDGKS